MHRVLEARSECSTHQEIALFFGSYVESIIQNTKVIVNPTAYHSSVTDPTVKCYN